jgi:DNA recombination protein RmuC
MNSDLIWIALLILAGAAGLYFSSRSQARGRAQGREEGRREAELEAAPLRGRVSDLETRLATTEARLETAQKALQDSMSREGALESTATRVPELEKALRELQNQAASDSQDLSSARTELQILRDSAPRTLEAMRMEFSSIAERLLKEKGGEFAEQNKTSLETLLTPLRDRLKDFEKKVDDSQKEGRDQHIELKTQIRDLLGMNQQLSLEAQNLTTALKGENKKGGNWGEIVLERVLEMSGLEKGREYEVQQAYSNDEGKRKLPDAVVHLPNKRQLIIDSKLSLLGYERYCSAETPEAAAAELLVHIASVRQHVRDLSEQRYHDLPGLVTPDFVFLFMPIEPAFIVAVKQDSALFQEAFNRNIIIVSPSTLLATLRTVANIWKQEYRHRNVEDIARQAGDLYDKFVGFLEDLDGVGDSLSKAQGRFEEARKKLKEGKGNLVGRVEKIRGLGIKFKKVLPASWQEDAGGDDEDPPARTQETLSLE